MSSQSTADVTVVISTFNRAKYLPEALDSILGQSIRPMRVVVVDDGSTDDTPSVLEAYKDRVEFVTKENGGKASALVMLFPSITTAYTWFFDDDDAAYPDALETLLAAACANPEAGFVFGCVDMARTESKLIGSTVLKGYYNFAGESLADQRLRLFRECTVMMTGALLRTEAVRSVGGPHAEQIRCQDYDLLVRLSSAYPFAFCGSSVYIWRDHDGMRGTAATAHRFADRLAVWATYNEPIGRFLRYELPLEAFVNEASSRRSVGGARRSSLVARAWAIAPKLPLEMAVSDLVDAFSEPALDPLGADELMYLRESFHDEFVGFRGVNALWPLWRLALTPAGSKALAEIAKGIYWRGRMEKRRRDRAKWIAAAVSLRVMALGGRAVHAPRVANA